MRRHIFVSKIFFVSLFLFILGCLFLREGISSYKKYGDALDLKSFAAKDYVEGRYVIGEIDSYVVKTVDTTLGPTYSGQSETWIHWFTQYVTYTIPLDDNRYIRIMVKDRGNISELEKFSQGQGGPITFKGIVYSASDIDYEWYEEIKGFDTDAILSDVVIREVNLDDRVKMVSPGVVFLVIAVICFVYGDAIAIVTVKEDEE